MEKLGINTVLVTVLITEETEGRVGADKMEVSRCPVSKLTVRYLSLLSRKQIQKIVNI